MGDEAALGDLLCQLHEISLGGEKRGGQRTRIGRGTYGLFDHSFALFDDGVGRVLGVADDDLLLRG